MINNLKILNSINDRLHKIAINTNNEELLTDAADLAYISTKLLLNVANDGDINRDLNSWKHEIKNIDLKSDNEEFFIYEAVYFLHIFSREALLFEYDDKKILTSQNNIEKTKEILSEIDKDFYEDLCAKINKYEDVLKYRFLHERVRKDGEDNLNEKLALELNAKQSEIEDISERIKQNKNILDNIESDTKFASIFAGFDNYSQKIGGKLKWVSWEVIALKILMILTPVAGVFIYWFGNDDFRVYLSLLSLLIVFGLLLRFSARKEDQMEQLLSNINTRTSLAVFHKYQISEMSDEEKLIANEKFQNFIYSEIKTSEWHAPDIAESIAQIIKSIKK